MKIIVLGAYGYTGQLVCEELMIAGVDFVGVGRNEFKLISLADKLPLALQYEKFDIQDPKQVANVIARFDVFINCIGPFAETAMNILEQLVKKEQKYYLDLTGESFFVQNSYDKFHQLAQKNRTTILHSCAFESVLTDLMGSILLENISDVHSIKSYYYLGKSKPSPGTKLTMKLSKYNDLVLIQAGKETPIQDIEPVEMSWDELGSFSAIPYPLPEICCFNWETKAKDIGSFLLVEQGSAGFMKFNPPSNTKEEVISKFKKRKVQGPSVSQREQQQFFIVVEVKGDSESCMQLEGMDMYRLTAKIVRYFVQSILKGGQERYGVLSPSQFLKEQNLFFETLNLKPKSC